MNETITYSVPGIHCAHCGISIREEVSEVEGVETVDVDLEAKVVTISGSFAAVGTALESVSVKRLEDHVSHCVAEALAAGDADVASRKSEDLLVAVQRFSRTR